MQYYPKFFYGYWIQRIENSKLASSARPQDHKVNYIGDTLRISYNASCVITGEYLLDYQIAKKEDEH
jgi:hypothetical protein